MHDTAALAEAYIDASKRKDLEAMASCWHEDCEGIHPLRPDRRWEGRDGFLRVWSRMWAENPAGGYEVVSLGVTPERFFLEARIQLPDGTVVPSVNVFEVDGARIRQVRVYGDVPRRDGVAIDDFISPR